MENVECGVENVECLRKRKLALDLRQKLLPIFPKGTVPKKYRFVRELPRNAQGKIQASELARLFEAQFQYRFACGGGDG